MNELPDCVPQAIYHPDENLWEEADAPCPMCGNTAYILKTETKIIAECDDCDFRQEVEL